MSVDRCRAPIPRDTLLAYWLGELGEPAEARLDEHVLGCTACAGQLQALVELGSAVRRMAQRGRLRVVVTGVFPKRLIDAGLQVREYRVPRNGSVHCTIAPDDDVVIACLEAPLAGIRQLDVLLLHSEGQGQQRLEHVPFNAAANAVSVVPGTDMLRALPASTMRMQLIAVEHGSDRLVGEYTFHHTPWSERPQE